MLSSRGVIKNLIQNRLLVPSLSSTKLFCSSSEQPPPTDSDPAIANERTKKEKPTPSAASEDAKKKLHSLLQNVKAKKNAASEKRAKEIAMAKPKKITQEDLEPLKSDDIEPPLADAAHLVSRHVAADERLKAKRIESDLLQQLRTVKKDTKEGKESNDIAALMGSFKVSKTAVVSEKDEERAQFLERRKRLRMRQAGDRDDARPQPTVGDYFKLEQPLGIFDGSEVDADDRVNMSTWQACQRKQLDLLTTLPPKNLLEDMAQMTDKGMLWHFPIDNEQGIDKDKLEPFHEHVFLEHHLESWCPERGPVRHFMEVVCHGLQKNPYISVEKKISHLEWFRQYFQKEEKQMVLELSGNALKSAGTSQS